jgi:hypothetical protein
MFETKSSLDEKLAIEEVYINGIELLFLESTIVGY